MRCTQQYCGSLATLLTWLQEAAVFEDPRAVKAAAALQEGALRREVDLLCSRAQLLAAAGRVSLRAPVGARHLGGGGGRALAMLHSVCMVCTSLLWWLFTVEWEANLILRADAPVRQVGLTKLNTTRRFMFNYDLSFQ